MRGLAGHREIGRADAAGGEPQRAVGAAALEREHDVLIGGEFGDGAAPAGRGDLLIAIGQHRERAIVLEIQLLQHRHGVENEGDALLVVGNAEAVGLVAVDAERLILQHALQVHRVHMGDQHDLLGAGALEDGVDGRADLLRRVVETIDVGRLQDLHRAADLLELVGYAACDQVQALEILAAGFDADEIAQRVEQRLLLLLRQRLDVGHRFGLRHGRGAGEPERCDQRANERWGRERSGHARRTMDWRMVRYARVSGACHATLTLQGPGVDRGLLLPRREYMPGLLAAVHPAVVQFGHRAGLADHAVSPPPVVRRVAVCRVRSATGRVAWIVVIGASPVR